MYRVIKHLNSSKMLVTLLKSNTMPRLYHRTKTSTIHPRHGETIRVLRRHQWRGWRNDEPSRLSVGHACRLAARRVCSTGVVVAWRVSEERKGGIARQWRMVMVVVEARGLRSAGGVVVAQNQGSPTAPLGSFTRSCSLARLRRCRLAGGVSMDTALAPWHWQMADRGWAEHSAAFTYAGTPICPRGGGTGVVDAGRQRKKPEDRKWGQWQRRPSATTAVSSTNSRFSDLPWSCDACAVRVKRGRETVAKRSFSVLERRSLVPIPPPLVNC